MNRKPKQPSRWTRRAVLAALFTPLGYVGYRVAAHNQWIVITRNGRSFDVGQEPNPIKAQRSLSLLVVGDTGKETGDRAHVIAAMRRHASWSSPDAAILLGDNFYEYGVDSVDDPRFDSDFEKLFDSASFDIPFYVCLGNHDVGGDADAQVAYTRRSERWRMPARNFKTTETAGNATVDLVVLDTNAMLEDSDLADEQLDWLREQLTASTADWKLVAGHHPAITGGQHEVDERIGRVLPPLFEEFDVDLYLSGHDHDLQMLDSGQGWKQIVSGAGSKLRSTSWIDETMFAKATPGFCWLLIEEDQLAVSFFSTGQRLFTHLLPIRVRDPVASSVLERTTK